MPTKPDYYRGEFDREASLELLAACKALIECVGSPDYDLKWLYDVTKQARAAIAKAENTCK